MRIKPRFFCDNCGTEVDRNTNTCPNCGRFFAAVLCPKCGFSAGGNSFKNGCPSCGYSTPGFGAAYPGEKKIPAGKLPLWVYILSVFAFILAVSVLIYKLA